MKAALYLRVSTNKQDYERQKRELIDYATKDSCEIKYIFEEKGSGLNNERPEFKKLQLLTNDDVDRIYIWEMSRISRRAYKMLQVCEEFAEKKISIYAKKENLHTLEDDGKWNTLAKLTLGLFASMAQTEIDTIKERTISGKRDKVSTGQISYTTNPPLGYKIIDKKLVIDEETVDKVRQIFNLYLEGYSFNQLSAMFNIDTSIVLRNEVYTGEKTNPFNPEQKLTTPKIIEKEVFNKAQILIKLHNNNTNIRYGNNPFSCKVKCGKCGETLSAYNANRKPQSYMRCKKRCSIIKTEVLYYIVKKVLKQIYSKKTEGIRIDQLNKELKSKQVVLKQKNDILIKVVEKEQQIIKKIKALLELSIDISDDEVLLKSIRKVKNETEKEITNLNTEILDIKNNIKEDKENLDWNTIEKNETLLSNAIRKNIDCINIHKIDKHTCYIIIEVVGTNVMYLSLINSKERKMDMKVRYIIDILTKEYSITEIIKLDKDKKCYENYRFEPYTIL